MRLGRAARKQLDELIAGAAPLEGDFFRSVAFHYFHPDDVISGEGTRLNGGRFVPVGVKASMQVLKKKQPCGKLMCAKGRWAGGAKSVSGTILG